MKKSIPSRLRPNRPSVVGAALLLAVAFTAASVQAAPTPPPVQWQSARLGNVFLTGQPVELPFRADADEAQWQITDFWHQEVEAGSTPIMGGSAVIKPRVAAAGYYLLHVSPKKGGAMLPDGYTSFAVVRAHASRDPLHSPFGVMTHFAQGMDPAMLPTFKEIGIESIRDEHYWGQVERTKGVYQFPPKSDAYMAAAKQDGIYPLVSMTFGNKFYDTGDGPSTPAGYAAYGNYGQAILKQYGDQIHWLEIWNEYNGSWCPKPAQKDRPAFYAEMLKVAYEKIKAVRPDVQVLGGAAVLIPLPYFEGVFKHDGLKYMDGVVIHPYRGRPEGVDAEVEALKELIRRYNGGQDKPIWVTETGLMNKDEYEWEKGRQTYEKGRAETARYLARQYALLLKEKVAKVYWYLSTDHLSFVSMGLLRNHDNEASGMGNYAVAPAFVSYANLIDQLDGAEYVRRDADAPYTRSHVELFRRGPEEIRVCWATQPGKIQLRARQPLKLVNLMGAESVLTPVDGLATVALNEDTVFIQGHADAVTEVDTGRRVLASSAEDYSKNQGDHGWYYGYSVGGGPFQELTQTSDMWGYRWRGPTQFLGIWQDGEHPDKSGALDVTPIRRWKSPVAGKVKIKAAWTCDGKGDGVTGVIVVDGVPLASQRVGGASPKHAEVEVPAVVKQGSCVDFVLGPNASTDFDSTNCDFTVSQEN